MRHASSDRSTRGLRTRELRRNPVLAAGMAVLVALLVCWPFVREPPLDLRDAYFHLFGAWSAAILVAWWLSRGVADGEPGKAPRE